DGPVERTYGDQKAVAHPFGVGKKTRNFAPWVREALVKYEVLTRQVSGKVKRRLLQYVYHPICRAISGLGFGLSSVPRCRRADSSVADRLGDFLDHPSCSGPWHSRLNRHNPTLHKAQPKLCPLAHRTLSQTDAGQGRLG